MKKTLIPVLLMALALTSCDALSNLTKFDMPLTSSVTIAKISAATTTPVVISTPDIETNSTKFFTDNGISTDLIGKVTLKKMELTVTTPTTGNFNFLKSIDIYITATDLTKTKIATVSNVSAGLTVVPLVVEDIDLKQFLLKEKVKMEFSVATDEAMTADYTIEVKPTFLIDMKVLGL